MREVNIDRILKNHYSIKAIHVTFIDSSTEDDLRLNYIINQKYILRIYQAKVLSEERLKELDYLSQCYQMLGLQVPRIYPNKKGMFSTLIEEHHIAYLSDYLAYDTCESMSEEQFRQIIYPQILSMIGKFSTKFKNHALSNHYSMWTIEKLSPFDIEIDEKQENFNELIDYLCTIEATEIVKRLRVLNESCRHFIRQYFEDLPKAVIQGDLNPSNILYKNDHFIGLIDFNMAGTEVNINHFVSETNGFPDFGKVNKNNYIEFIDQWMLRQQEDLQVILKYYALNEIESKLLPVYRAIGLISQYPNVQGYLKLLKKDGVLGLSFIEYLMDKVDAILFRQ